MQLYPRCITSVDAEGRVGGGLESISCVKPTRRGATTPLKTLIVHTVWGERMHHSVCVWELRDVFLFQHAWTCVCVFSLTYVSVLTLSVCVWPVLSLSFCGCVDSSLALLWCELQMSVGGFRPGFGVQVRISFSGLEWGVWEPPCRMCPHRDRTTNVCLSLIYCSETWSHNVKLLYCSCWAASFAWWSLNTLNPPPPPPAPPEKHTNTCTRCPPDMCGLEGSQ